MNEHSTTTTAERDTLLRGLFMFLMAFFYQLAGTLLFFIAIIQFVIALINGTPNARLVSFGRSLGTYIKQIVSYLTFASDDRPFPFSDWPAGD